MDAGEYDTNTLLINNLSSIAYRIYAPVAAPSSAYTFAASDVEEALRNDGQLVYMDAVRRGIWCFYLAGKDDSSPSQPEQLGLDTTIEVCGYRLQLVEEGRFEPSSLLNRPPGFNSINTPSSSTSSGSALDMPAKNAQATSASAIGASGALASGQMDLDTKVGLNPTPEIKGYGSVPIREIHEFFITAVLSSLSAGFCHQLGAIPLNHRTVLLTSKVFQPDYAGSDPSSPTSALATFRAYLTTTGTFVISLSVSLAQGLVSLAESSRLHLPGGSSVLTAPMGAFATFSSVVIDGDSAMVQSPDTQISRYRAEPSDRFAQWRTTCSRLLQMRGMSASLLDGCSWLNIHFIPRKLYDHRTDGRRTPMSTNGPIAPWPAVLCFGKTRRSLRKTLPAAEGKNLDPLGFTRDWLLGAPEREQLSKKKREREAASALEAGEGEGASLLTSGYSPLQLRGPANQTTASAAGAMYPTPPGGVQPGVTPSFDGTLSSPGNHPTATTMVDADAPANPAPPPQDAFDDNWEGADQKREQQNVAFLEGENLFGDLDEDVFESNELTDADFNFFDEEPDGDNLDLAALDDIEMSTGLPETAAEPVLEPAPEPESKPESRPASPQFTKPELKHARSSLIENRQQLNAENFHTNTAVGIKRHSSPFNADTVYKRIRASLRGLPAATPDSKDTNAPPRRGSVFERVEFDPALSLTNKKYQGKGQFNPTLPLDRSKKDGSFDSGGPLASRYKKYPKELSTGLGSLMAKITGNLEHNSPQHNFMRRDDPPSDADDVSLVSDQDDTSDTSDEPSSPAISGVVRRRADDDVISMAASFKDLENATADMPAYGSIDLSRLSIPENPELSLAKYFADPDPVPFQLSRADEDCITIAQILTEQAVTGDLKLFSPTLWSEPQEVRRTLMSAVRHSMQGLRYALPKALGSAAECQLRPLIEAQDVPLLGQPARTAPRPAGQELVRPNIFSIPAPHVEVRRFENKISLLPSAVAFWESLGLGPAEGGKDIVSLCVFPGWEGVQSSASDFLDGIRSSYETMKLGTFDRMSTSGGIDNGLVPYDTVLEPSSHGFVVPRAASNLLDQMTRLGQALAASTYTERNFVVFFIYDPDTPGLIVDSCSAFQELFEKYKRALSERKKQVTNELVLQLVPMNLVASETTMVVLTPRDSFRLCVEVYDRCTLFEGPMPAPAIRLEEPLPRVIDFKLTTIPSASLLHEKSCVHIAYALSVDERWVTAAWTDNQGSKQMTASYCLARRGKPPSTSFHDIAHEIWETTHDLISIWKVHWRVIITKCGPMDQAEAEFWTQLAQTESKATVSLTLLAVDTRPSLQLIPPLVRIPLTAPSTFYSTPVSTPQPMSIVSPDQSGNPSTPMGATPGVTATTPGGENSVPEPDGETTLVDVTDATWGMVVAHRLNNSTSLTDLNPSLVSGYLVKRGGPRPEDAPVVMEVNIVHSEGNPRMFEAVLREMLTHFRGLGALARVRGMVDPATDVRPWHVAAAEKGARALYQLM
ncbi:hypothetical protein GQ53DRAFT_679708 [Thozetella sp. PMI_491]|nr:hypothetical protein GQ53DRAFT_679708 [Thozetella sp. PMI_491]